MKSYRSEKELLAKMKDFNELSNIKREIELDKKKKLYISLERKVQDMKSEVYEIDTLIEEKLVYANDQKELLKGILTKNQALTLENNIIRLVTYYLLLTHNDLLT